MKTSVKSTLMALLSLSIVLASPVPGTKAGEPRDAGYAWVIIRFNFCPDGGARTRKPEAVVLMKWEGVKRDRFMFRCNNNSNNPLYRAKGAVVRINTLDRPPLREGTIVMDPSNCTVGPILREQPPEYDDRQYYRDTF